MGGGPEFSYPTREKKMISANRRIASDPDKAYDQVVAAPIAKTRGNITVAEQLAAIKTRRHELMNEREAIVLTYEQQLTQLEDTRKELSQVCPHANMLYGIYNQCADCEEWF